MGLDGFGDDPSKGHGRDRVLLHVDEHIGEGRDREAVGLWVMKGQGKLPPLEDALDTRGRLFDQGIEDAPPRGSSRGHPFTLEQTAKRLLTSSGRHFVRKPRLSEEPSEPRRIHALV